MVVPAEGELIYSTKNLTDDDLTDEGSFTEAQTWGALKNAWKGYKVAKRENDIEKLRLYAARINRFQKRLGLPLTDFEIYKTKNGIVYNVNMNIDKEANNSKV